MSVSRWQHPVKVRDVGRNCCGGKVAGFTHLVGQRVGTKIPQRKLELSILILTADDDLDGDRRVWR